jgi:hypothetical protein
VNAPLRVVHIHFANILVTTVTTFLVTRVEYASSGASSIIECRGFKVNSELRCTSSRGALSH